MKKWCNRVVAIVMLTVFSITALAENSLHYTVLDADEYKLIVNHSRSKVQQLLKTLQAHSGQNINAQIAFISQQLLDIPYIHTNGMGEGDWQPRSSVYKPGGLHVKQNPVYRLDALNCQTFVQITMALLHANTLAQFDNNIVKIAYGAAGNPNGDIIRYYNRNNFTDADFNPINQRNGWLTDATSQSVLAPYTKSTSAIITRQKWFLYQQQNRAETVQVLAKISGPAMVQRFMTTYAALRFPHFDSEQISIRYIPKEFLAIKQFNRGFQPNQALLDKIPTPAIAEIVRDVKKWNINGIKIKDIIGSELTVSHLGFLYRQSYHYGDIIYRKISCAYAHQLQKICHVTSITCKKNQCNELMFSHATDAYPIGYFWYQKSNGNYVCLPNRPSRGVRYTYCNRVVQTPFFDYLIDYQLGLYWNMDVPSVLGVHIETLN